MRLDTLGGRRRNRSIRFAAPLTLGPGTEEFRNGLTEGRIGQARRSVDQTNLNVSDTALRLAIAATRGLLIDPHSGSDHDAIEAAIRRLAELRERSM